MKDVDNKVLIDVADFLKRKSSVSYSAMEKRAGIRPRKLSAIKVGRVSTNLKEIHAVLIAYPEATQFYLDTIQQIGLNRSGYEWALAVEKLLKNLHSRESIAEKLGVGLDELKAMQKNINGITDKDRDKVFKEYPELSLLPSFNPDESEESLALRIKHLEKEVMELRQHIKDDQIIDMIRQLQKDINKLK